METVLKRIIEKQAIFDLKMIDSNSQNLFCKQVKLM